MAKVFDVFPFFNELDLLEIRLHELDPVVDFFVITEASTTFSGIPKPFYFEDYKEDFLKFSHKILYQKIEKVPNSLTPFEREWFQRDATKAFLQQHIKPTDFLIYGDLDEIPRSKVILDAVRDLKEGIEICHCAMELCYYYLNLSETSGTLPSYMGEYPNIKRKKWLGTTISKWEYASQFSMTELRSPKHKGVGLRIDNAGWHFSFVGGHQKEDPLERIVRKIKSYAHQELNNEVVLRKVRKRLSKNKDVFGRRRAKFKKVNDTSFLPQYVVDNYAKFDHLILK